MARMARLVVPGYDGKGLIFLTLRGRGLSLPSF